MKSENTLNVMKALSSNNRATLHMIPFNAQILQMVIDKLPENQRKNWNNSNEFYELFETLVAFALIHYGDDKKEIVNQ